MKLSEAQDKNIKVRCNISQKLIVFENNVDICILMANLLDNAIEAASDPALSDLSSDMKVIELDLKKTDKFFLVSVKNPSAKEPLVNEGEMETIKSDKKNHGFGMTNMRMAVDKYDGAMEVSTETIDENDYFVVEIML